ncbi:MATE family efflux transporter [Pseudofulvibacter geojedonensis]|uniref:Multidrug-efflux transporter n=1 Tax=Pseudofulvibacter geojedonensis TaxID=1123758 RepID=A0ABW3I3G4_9FLAO
MKIDLSFNAINKLAVPALIAGIAEPIISATDLAIIGNLPEHSVEAASAVGIVVFFLNFLIWTLGQSRSAISSIISQYLGAGKLDEVKNLPMQAMLIVFVISVVILGITYPFARDIFSWYKAKGLVLDYCVDYYQIRALGFPLILITFAIIGTFRGLQNTYYPMLVALTGLVLNIGLDFLLVFGVEGFVEPMGLPGAAWASVVSQVVMVVMAFYLLYTKTDILFRLQFPFNKEIKNLLIMIFNLFVRTLALNIAINLAMRYATGYGETYSNAYSIAINLWFICAFVIDGYASAGNMLAGRLLGANDYVNLNLLRKKLTKYGLTVGILLFLVLGVLYLPIGRLYSNNPEVRSVFYNSFWLTIAMQPLCAIAFIYDGMYKGMGRMKKLRNLLLISTFLGFIPVLYFSDYLGLKLHGIWLAFVVWIFIRGLILKIDFKKVYVN